MSLKLDKIIKEYPDFLIDVSFEAETGQILTLLGPSGCGKTTILHIIAGFIQPDRGRILLNNRDMTYLPPHMRKVGLVFQDYSLFPHMNVFNNIAFGLKMQRWNKKTMEDRVKELLHLIRLSRYEPRIVTELSGGEQQRVALARALAPNPDILLLDEPLSALDARLRKDLRKEIRRIQQELKITTIYVTHDQEEALAISDKIAIMDNGSVEQTGTPFDIYHKPTTRFVANFIGITNQIHARVSRQDGEYLILVSREGELRVKCGNHAKVGSRVMLFIRPEKCSISKKHHGTNAISGIITHCEFLGDSTSITLKSQQGLYTVKLGGALSCKTDEKMTFTFSPEDCWILNEEDN
jgi:ABC-type Fe3+/spermidine/putrescine transport system ATPase subunit